MVDFVFFSIFSISFSSEKGHALVRVCMFVHLKWSRVYAIVVDMRLACDLSCEILIFFNTILAPAIVLLPVHVLVLYHKLN